LHDGLGEKGAFSVDVMKAWLWAEDLNNGHKGNCFRLFCVQSEEKKSMKEATMGVSCSRRLSKIFYTLSSL
jgi:hypothetical protein